MSKRGPVTLAPLINPDKQELGVGHCFQQALYLRPGWVSGYVHHALEGPNIHL